MLTVFEFIIVIVAISVLGGVLHAKYRAPGSADGQDTANAVDAQRLRDEVKMLKERIAVLERIATDKESSLDREIERLRDR